MFQAASIFLAEDSPADVYLFREALKAHDIECNLLVCSDGEKAMSFLLKAEKDGPVPEVFVLDLNLPKIDGREILRRLRDSSRFAQAPVIILTSSDDPIDRADCMNLGADRYVRKAAKVSEFLKIGGIVKAMIGQTLPLQELR
jgi:CheY-like chemotaxis protein